VAAGSEGDSKGLMVVAAGPCLDLHVASARGASFNLALLCPCILVLAVQIGAIPLAVLIALCKGLSQGAVPCSDLACTYLTDLAHLGAIPCGCFCLLLGYHLGAIPCGSVSFCLGRLLGLSPVAQFLSALAIL
jgi:hypothetical protein